MYCVSVLVTKFKLSYFGHNSLKKAVMQTEVKEKMTNSKMGGFSYSGDECPVGKQDYVLCSFICCPHGITHQKMGIIDV